ncbi:N-carbamoyl-L-amino-acid hydrolase [Muriicola jejuensis]|uniref:Hydantoinase/carbamoylase family amidase n=1 Tax=Muriicola jejuensis TaxID=504488 RepID=A0A6P0U8X6_9FLAO|nr:Zn-dependent hydrolase [Muriicola jejuensis]NER08992.1 hydantoinase/carbamoylase family amidase [Muriicola jejuensis]SMP12421.1 N-carbamoyl-L-amino-acid hydrolase [Muriicola jejuensis]
MRSNNFVPCLLLLVSIQLYTQEIPEVDQDRLEDTIYMLAKHGMMENGETNRVAFSDADLQGRAYIISLMQVSGLEVSVDFAGNIIGKRKGRNSSMKPIGFGSHIDMVPNGGNYDGCVGSLAAIEVIRTLNEAGIKTEHPLEVFIFSNEEGGVMGSRALVGELKEDALGVVNSTGYSMREGINRLGGNADRIPEVERPEGSLAAFLELHIEQGGILDKEGLDIGVVEGIVGINWWDVRVSGFANHAGTTPMDLRKDALLAAAKFIIVVNEETLKVKGNQVGTVGRISALPGAPNVIPGEVQMSLEIRDLSSEKMDRLFKAMKMRAEAIEREMGVAFSFSPIDANPSPALTDPEIRKIIAEAAGELGLSTKNMQSGAGHDAQDMSRITPVGMIFVPSVNGISHSPKEYTSPEDMANGANVLLRAILKIDESW